MPRKELHRSPVIGKELYAIRNDKVVLARVQMVESNRGVVVSYTMATDELAEGEFPRFIVAKKYTGENREELMRKLFKLKLKGLI